MDMLKKFLEDQYGGDSFALVRHSDGTVGIHQQKHMSLSARTELNIVAENLTWREAQALKKINNGY